MSLKIASIANKGIRFWLGFKNPSIFDIFGSCMVPEMGVAPDAPYGRTLLVYLLSRHHVSKIWRPEAPPPVLKLE